MYSDISIICLGFTEDIEVERYGCTVIQSITSRRAGQHPRRRETTGKIQGHEMEGQICIAYVRNMSSVRMFHSQRIYMRYAAESWPLRLLAPTKSE
jgi:hypothetical protein